MKVWYRSERVERVYVRISFFTMEDRLFIMTDIMNCLVNKDVKFEVAL